MAPDTLHDAAEKRLCSEMSSAGIEQVGMTHDADTDLATSVI
jgi:hypothetical protein